LKNNKTANFYPSSKWNAVFAISLGVLGLIIFEIVRVSLIALIAKDLSIV